MNKKPKNILVVYKKSAYKIYFLERRNVLKQGDNTLLKADKKKLLNAHEEHYQTLDYIHHTLKDEKLNFKEIHRATKRDYSPYDLIISVGGDGTFLECARNIKKQLLLGVNSAPSHSVGRLCTATRTNFKSILSEVLQSNHKEKLIQRLKIDLPDQRIYAVNDVLICHLIPAALSRYFLMVDETKEEQRSSGVWISSPIGSSGGIFSAGGKLLDTHAKKIQYMPRELYAGGGRKYKLKGAVLEADSKISMLSVMRKGRIYVDGIHQEYNFPYGSLVKVSLSNNPLRNVVVK